MSAVTGVLPARADLATGEGRVINQSKDVLLLGAFAPSLELLRERLVRLGYRAVPAKTPEQAHMLLRISRGAIGAAVLAPDLPVVDLRRTLRFLCDVSAGELWFLAAGSKPDHAERARLRAAGVTFPLFEPLHAHTLRFQINRALAGSSVVRGERRSLRAPTTWEVPVFASGRSKAASVYTVSSAGAFLGTPAPSPRGARIDLELPVAGLRGRLAARVGMTNVPGNLQHKNLPVGMGVRFENPPLDAEALLHVFAQERLSELML